MKVTPFCLSHDAADPLGYIFECEGSRLGYVTDTGIIMRNMPELLAGVQGLYLESNYDPDMLANSGRPLGLIRRISGRWGHLSNEQACDFVRSIAHKGLQHLVLAHLSQDCNTPQKAFNCMQNTLCELQLPTNLYCAPAATRLPWVHIA
jgi:phosphoribosyl 1,2-cyclic phosphodiesterase